MKNASSITFKDLKFEHGCYVKLIWNGKVLFDDYSTDPGICGPELIGKIRKRYDHKLVYSYKVKIVHFHHCILDIKGEN